jgi:NAD(P)-dependent dehydrogenase (short-subunit alcohol dehydrogenase family)
MGELDGKVAVIIGAGSGMGRASARVFVREGAQVLGVGRSERVEEAAQELGDSFVPFRGDVSIETDVEAMFGAAVNTFGRVDAVLNSAGSGGLEPLADVTLDQYEQIMAVNLRGIMLSTKYGIRTMVPTGGGVVLNWSSSGGVNAAQMPVSVYSAAKAGGIAFTKAAAIEYGTQGIRANVICPGGVIVTEMMGGPEALAQLSHLVQAVPLQRACQPEEVGELACFLASDRAPFITGAVVHIDGGQTALLPS